VPRDALREPGPDLRLLAERYEMAIACDLENQLDVR
jgi:hypothetical protein